MSINTIAELMTYGTMVMAVMVFNIIAITEVFKGTKFLDKVPTDLLVVVLGVTEALVALFAAAWQFGFTVEWPMVVAAIVVGFLVAFVCMFGWDKFHDLWSRIKPKN